MKQDKRADFGIINFWWCDDHGAILTAFALQQFLAKEGFSSELLKCWMSYDDESRKGGISALFEKQYMKSSTKIYRTYDDIFVGENNLQLNNDYIGFITGSDQVFRPDYVPDSWYLSFVKGKGKIAAAASFGTNQFICDDANRFNRISKSLKSFDYISVREDSGVVLCKEKFGVDATHILDPVFLIDKKEYEKIICNSELKKGKDFIFCYVRDLTPNIKHEIEKIGFEGKYEIKWCSDKMPIEDFLFNVSNCSCIITDSYHGMCFSIIFNKDFMCIKNEERGRARFDSLQKQLGLSDKNFLDEKEQMDRIIPIEYYSINNNLNRLSENGKKWLKNTLSETYQKYS